MAAASAVFSWEFPLILPVLGDILRSFDGDRDFDLVLDLRLLPLDRLLRLLLLPRLLLLLPPLLLLDLLPDLERLLFLSGLLSAYIASSSSGIIRA